MKHSFSSVVVLAFLLHLPALVLGAPFSWGNRHAYFARSIAANETTTAAAEGETASTTLEKAAEATETFVNSTIIAEETATATKTEAESTASATVIHGGSPLQTALLPSITDWNSCQSFLSSSGINLFVNQVNLKVDVVVNKVNIIQVLIDERGRARQTRVLHAFPQPTDYYPEFDQRKNKGGKKPGNKPGNRLEIGKGKATPTHLTATITATPVAKETEEVTATNTETASEAEETATATETASQAEETATETASQAEETATETASEAEETATATASEAKSEETSHA